MLEDLRGSFDWCPDLHLISLIGHSDGEDVLPRATDKIHSETKPTEEVEKVRMIVEVFDDSPARLSVLV